MSEEEKKQIQIVNNFVMYCRGFEEKKFTEKELFTAIEFLDELIQKKQKEIEELKKDKLYKIGYMHGCNDTSKFNDDNFIRKQKIQDIINKLEPIIEEYENQIDKDIDTDLSYEEAREIQSKIEAYKELLKED